jgi:hypothetical protein
MSDEGGNGDWGTGGVWNSFDAVDGEGKWWAAAELWVWLRLWLRLLC